LPQELDCEPSLFLQRPCALAGLSRYPFTLGVQQVIQIVHEQVGALLSRPIQKVARLSGIAPLDEHPATAAVQLAKNGSFAGAPSPPDHRGRQPLIKAVEDLTDLSLVKKRPNRLG
jgi:hypothetical protein